MEPTDLIYEGIATAEAEMLKRSIDMWEPTDLIYEGIATYIRHVSKRT